MEDGSRKKIVLGIFMVVLLLVGVLVGTVLTQNLSRSTNTKTSASQNSSTVSALEVLNPQPGVQINQKIDVKARMTYEEDIKPLTAFFKVGDMTAVAMKLERQAAKVVVTGSLDPTSYPKGRNPFTISLYDGNGTLIGTSVFYVTF